MAGIVVTWKRGVIRATDFIQSEPNCCLYILFEISLCVPAESVMRVIIYYHSVFVRILFNNRHARGVYRARAEENNTEFSPLMELRRFSRLIVCSGIDSKLWAYAASSGLRENVWTNRTWK
jgi:hypothetical protein